MGEDSQEAAARLSLVGQVNRALWDFSRFTLTTLGSRVRGTHREEPCTCGLLRGSGQGHRKPAEEETGTGRRPICLDTWSWTRLPGTGWRRGRHGCAQKKCRPSLQGRESATESAGRCCTATGPGPTPGRQACPCPAAVLATPAGEGPGLVCEGSLTRWSL